MPPADPHRPISPPPAVGPRGSDLPAYLSNGMIGLRVRENPLEAGMCIVSGFSGEHPERLVEGLCPAPYPLAGDLGVDGVWLSDNPSGFQPVDQALDFESGELTTRITYTAGDVRLDVEILTFCSRDQPALVFQQLRVTASAACRLSWRARIDPHWARGRLVQRLTDTPGEATPVCDGALLWAGDGDLSRCGVAYLTQAPEGAERSVDQWNRTGPLMTEYALSIDAGRSVVLTQIVALVPSQLHAQPHLHATRLCAQAKHLGFERLRADNRRCWARLWRSRIRLVGADVRWQALADAALFYLNASTHPSSPSSTSIFGLAAWPDYHYYFGHVMWDIDAFATPVLSVVQPGAARALLDFRTRGLNAARDNARLMGLPGLQFPWEAAPSSGQEATPGGGDALFRELHINMHVARAFDFHAKATGDGRFLRDQAWPVLSGVADWLTARLETDPDGSRHLRDIGGPAERETTVDDDALTLMSGRLMLQAAQGAAERLDLPAPSAWLEAADAISPPIRADGAIASHIGYRRGEEKGATPSPLMAIFPYWSPLDPQTQEATLRFYLDQWEDYVGSPMLAALYGTWAAWLGDRDLSLKLMHEGYGAYMHGRFEQTLEYRLDKMEGPAAGPFVANTGGFLTGLLFGLPALRIDDGPPERWPVRPVVLPRGWEAIEVDVLHIHGREWRLRAVHGADRAELTPL